MPFLKKTPPFTETPAKTHQPSEPLINSITSAQDVLTSCSRAVIPQAAIFLTCHQSLSVQQICRTIFHIERDCDAFKSSVDATRDINKSCWLAGSPVMIQCRLCSAHHSLSGSASGGAVTTVGGKHMDNLRCIVMCIWSCAWWWFKYQTADITILLELIKQQHHSST